VIAMTPKMRRRIKFCECIDENVAAEIKLIKHAKHKKQSEVIKHSFVVDAMKRSVCVFVLLLTTTFAAEEDPEGEANILESLRQRCAIATGNNYFHNILFQSFSVSMDCFLLNALDGASGHDIERSLQKAIENDNQTQLFNDFCAEAVPALNCFGTFTKKLNRCLTTENDKKFSTAMRSFASDLLNVVCHDNGNQFAGEKFC